MNWMSNEFITGNLRIRPPSGWLDVTTEIGVDNPPFTLAKNDGVGVIQFSVAKYSGGDRPQITIENLKHLLADFAQSRELERGFDAAVREQPLLTCAQSYNHGTQFLRVWYCSNRFDVALVTYVCEMAVQERELPECESIINSLEFIEIV